MKHATESTLDALETLLTEIRRHQGLNEKKCGTFYKKSVAFLHFHEDPAGLFADLKVGKEWVRYPVSTPNEQQVLLANLANHI